MSLRSKILYTLAVVVALYAALSCGIQRLVVFPSFVHLENNKAKTNMERFIEALNREIENFHVFSHDWAAWDDTYQYVRDKNEEYIQSNLVDTTFTNQHLNLVYIYDANGAVVWGKSCNLLEGQAQPIAIDEFPADRPPANPAFLARSDPEWSLAGIFMTSHGPMMVTCRPIITSENTGPVRGTLIMGRLLTEKIVQMLAKQTRLSITVCPIPLKESCPRMQSALQEITPGHPTLIKPVNENNLEVYATFPDINKTPSLLIRADVIREITAQGAVAINFALFSMLAGGFVILLVLYVILKKIILSPVALLSAHALRISQSGDLTARLALNRSDEIGTLADQFDKMVAELAEVRKKLLEQSYNTGMAEMASGVLHNVRNALTPITVEIENLCREIGKVPFQQIETASQQLMQPDTPQPRRQALQQFLELANKSTLTLVQGVETKLKNIIAPVRQVEEILSDHDKFCYSDKPLESFGLDELVRDAMLVLSSQPTSSVAINLDPSLGQIGKINAHRISLLQVFSNILLNAVESVGQADATPGRIYIRADVENENNTEVVHMKIIDNGTGFQPGQLEKIFQRGFTTKQSGNCGFGLHWCANTITALKGRIYAENRSDGPGACFHVIWPKN